MKKDRVEIIAECGINTEGNILTALKMIESAKLAGANTVKFQLVNPDFYSEEDPLHKIFKDTYLTPEQHTELKAYCEEVGVNYLCTPSDVEMAKVLVNTVGVKRLKVASDSIKNEELLRYIEENNLECLVSTGMVLTDNFINTYIVDKWYAIGATILYCVSKYPCLDNELELEKLKEMEVLYPPFGYSDHSDGIMAPVIAVGLGARVIEKHFKITSDCVDANVSIFPDEFSQMVSLIRQVEQML